MRECVVLLVVVGLCGVVEATLPTPTTYSTGLPFRGINLSGAEWGSWSTNVSSFIPAADDAETLALVGANVFRFPIGWEHVQPQGPGTDLSQDYVNRVVPPIKTLLSSGFSVLLDLHNYMRYNGTVVSASQLADVWTRLLGGDAFGPVAKAYGGDGKEAGPQLFLDLMNEPHTMPSSAMVANYNAALKAIRGLGFLNLAFVEGNSWTGLHSWTQGSPPNSVAFESITDPRVVVNVHQYLDSDSSGSHTECITPDEFPGKVNFDAFVNWLATTKRRAFLSEFGASYNPDCVTVESTLLELVSNHSVGSKWAQGSMSVGFMGFTAWAAGHAWGNHYIYGLNPGDQAQAMLVATLGKFMTPPAGLCDTPGYLLAFNSTPPAMMSGYSVQTHNPSWSDKSTIAHADSPTSPPPVTCIPASQVNQTGVALYDHEGKQFVCSQSISASTPILDLTTCVSS